MNGCKTQPVVDVKTADLATCRHSWTEAGRASSAPRETLLELCHKFPGAATSLRLARLSLTDVSSLARAAKCTSGWPPCSRDWPSCPCQSSTRFSRTLVRTAPTSSGASSSASGSSDTRRSNLSTASWTVSWMQRRGIPPRPSCTLRVATIPMARWTNRATRWPELCRLKPGSRRGTRSPCFWPTSPVSYGRGSLCPSWAVRPLCSTLTSGLSLCCTVSPAAGPKWSSPPQVGRSDALWPCAPSAIVPQSSHLCLVPSQSDLLPSLCWLADYYSTLFSTVFFCLF